MRLDAAFFVQLELAGIDLGEVEDVVDDVVKMLAALVDELGVFRLARLERAHHPQLERLGETDDRVERRAQFVAHIGEELRLGDIRPLSRLFRLP